jgi:acyl-CoA synthetase (AMP-forming)/AMP-acid ligase II
MILEMASDNLGARIALGSRHDGVSFEQLGRRSRRGGTWLADSAGERVVLVDENSPAVPLALFGAAVAGKPFVPVNYRLADEKLRAILGRTAPATVIVGAGVEERVEATEGLTFVRREDFLAVTEDDSIPETDGWGCDPEATAVLLFTSGTTGEPKAAVLRHRNLAAYLVASVEFGAAGADEAAIVSVPPYHIAAVSSVLSNTYAGRRVVQLAHFEPQVWVDTVRAESITHAMVVPTMLNRLLDVIEADGGGLPSLRSLAYGGGPMPLAVVERAMELIPEAALVNAYGLTETASTIAVLGPQEHRLARNSSESAVRARLGSVGKPIPGVEVSVRDPSGDPVAAGTVGEIWVRGEQVSGEYEGRTASADDGWFNTRDAGRVDEEGYLFVHGRLDDVIVRGGENLSPGEIEAVLLDHPAVAEAAVVGVPDVEWGETVAAAVVLHDGLSVTAEELRRHVRDRLRSARTPSQIAFVDRLPFSETGKLLRRALRDELSRPAERVD